MSQGRAEVGTAHRVGSGFGRLVRAWRALPPERHLAAAAAIGLFVTLFLPWYQVTVIATGSRNLQSASASLTAWGAFSFVEGAVLLVSGAVLVLLFQRAEGRAFHLPGGDGTAITIAGLWTCVLIIWRMFDKQGTASHGQYANTYGIEWGIFVALAVAALLAYSGSRIRAAHRPEPPLPWERPTDPLPPRPPARAPRAGTPSDDAAIRSREASTPSERAPAPPERPHPAARAERPDRPVDRAQLAFRAAQGFDPPAGPPEFELPPRPTPTPAERAARPTPTPAERPEATPVPFNHSEALTQRGTRPVRPPRPVRATDPNTVRLSRPATPAARTRSPDDGDRGGENGNDDSQPTVPNGRD